MNSALPKTAVCIMAHPDDAEISCFGSLLKLQHDGYDVHVIVACTGEHGVSVIDKAKQQTERLDADVRWQESLNAFQDTKISLQALNFEDGALALTKDLIVAIEEKLLQLKPTLLITHFDCDNGLDHQDHSIVAKACLNAASRISSVEEILQAEPIQSQRSLFSANTLINITNYFDAKINALQAHKSQAGRHYLTKEFHFLRCQQNALIAGRDYFNDDLLFESFKSILCVRL